MSKAEDKQKVDGIIKQIKELHSEAEKVLNPHGLRLTDGGYDDADFFVAGEWDESACWADPDVWDHSGVVGYDEEPEEDDWENSWEDSLC